MKKQEVEENLALVQKTLEQWLGFKKYLTKSFSDEQLSPDDESAFLEVKSNVARNVRTLSERAAAMGNLDYGGKVVQEMLKKCVSVAHLRGLPINDKRAIIKDWHGAFIRLSRTVGAFKFMADGYVPPPPKGSKAAAAAAKKKGGGKVVLILVIIAILGGAGFAAWFFLFS